MGKVSFAGKFVRFLWLAAMVPALLLTSAPSADAASAFCRKLERALARTSSGGGGGKIANAIRRQEAELAKATRRVRAANCGGLRGLFGGSECFRLNSTIRKMQSNLANLRARGGGGGDDFGERERILAAIDANECRNPRPKEQLVRVERERSVRDALEQERAERIREQEERRKDRREEREARKLPPAIERRDDSRKRVAKRDDRDDSEDNSLLNYAGDTYRTLCVRTCDGYYFPVSFSTTKQNFRRDQKACEQMCPGTETKLYYHHAGDEESEDMVAVEGNRPYSALPAAFLYRTKGTAGTGACTCQATASNYTIVGGAPDQEAKADEKKPAIEIVPEGQPVPINTWRIDPLTDPETYANLRGGLDEKARIKLLRGAVSGEDAAESGASKPVRVVGPAFLPDPEGAIDLRSPAPSIVQ